MSIMDYWEKLVPRRKIGIEPYKFRPLSNLGYAERTSPTPQSECPVILPENMKIDLCKRCGGTRMFWYKVEMLTAEEVKAQGNELKPILSHFKLCTCSNPKPKHDGKLDEDGKMRVRLTGDDGEEFQGKRQVAIMDEMYHGIGLSLAQARELLAWLEQERDAGRLEQEQEETA